MRTRIPVWLMTGVAATTLIATDASAQTAKERELEARITAIERALGMMQTDLNTARAENTELRAQVQAAEAKAATAQTTATAVQTAQAKPLPDGFTVGNGGTRVRLGGFIKLVASTTRYDDGRIASGALGRDFYLPQQIPVGGARGFTDTDFHAKATRLWMNLDTTVAGHSVKGYVETDFQTATGTQGSERTTNGYTLALRRAFLTVDKMTFGQDWTTFQNVAALPESTDFVGATEGTVFVRQPLIRYSAPVGKGTTLHVSAENGFTATASPTSAALIENDDARLPDGAVRLAHTGKFGEVSLAGLVRQLRVDNGTQGATATGLGASVAGKIFLDEAKRHDFRFMATYGTGIGRYVGLNFGADAIFVPATAALAKTDTLAALAAVRIGLSPKLRTNIMGSFQHVDYPTGFAAGTFNSFNKRAWSLAGNLFWTPLKNVDLGVEYRHGERELVSGVAGQLDRLEFAAKYSF